MHLHPWIKKVWLHAPAILVLLSRRAMDQRSSMVRQPRSISEFHIQWETLSPHIKRITIKILYTLTVSLLSTRMHMYTHTHTYTHMCTGTQHTSEQTKNLDEQIFLKLFLSVHKNNKAMTSKSTSKSWVSNRKKLKKILCYVMGVWT